MSFRRKNSYNQRNYSIIQEREYLNESNNLYESVEDNLYEQTIVDVKSIEKEMKQQEKEAKKFASKQRNYRRKKKAKRVAVRTAEATCIVTCGLVAGVPGLLAAGVLVYALEEKRKQSKQAKALIHLTNNTNSVTYPCPPTTTDLNNNSMVSMA